MQPAGPSSPSGRDLAGLGGMVTGALLAPLLAGIALDAALRTGPVFLLIGLVVGIAAAVLTMYVRFKRFL